MNSIKRMPKLIKGSEEAKKHMELLRQKRKRNLIVPAEPAPVDIPLVVVEEPAPAVVFEYPEVSAPVEKKKRTKKVVLPPVMV